jgi:predicted nucleotidyltransferase
VSPEDRRTVDLFAKQVRTIAPSAAIWVFGSRARGTAHPDSDIDLCVVIPAVSRQIREAIHTIAWEIGFTEGHLLAPIILSEDDFERAPMSASTLVAVIRREGIAA